jgi:ceramide glucosyltransferase
MAAAAIAHVLSLAGAVFVLGSWAYCLLLIIGTRRYRAAGANTAASRDAAPEPISILKPLHGLDEGLEANLRSFFEQDYPAFEILFAARQDNDPGLALARRLAAGYPQVPARFIVTGEPPWPNAKAYSLHLMQQAARHDLLVMSDSDIRATPRLLAKLAAEFSDPALGVATCPYRAIAGASFWSQLEAAGMNTEFWGGVFTARLVERGISFAIGPTIAARRTVLESIGGWPYLSPYLAEDFVLGNSAAAAGHGVILSSCVVEHRIGSQPLLANLSHRLRWNRSTRRSRGAGYVGQLFTNPLPLVLLLCAVWPLVWSQTWFRSSFGAVHMMAAHPWLPAGMGAWLEAWFPVWPMLVVTVLLRVWAALEVATWTLHARTGVRFWVLVWIQDLLSFMLWIAGFFGNQVRWRGRRYRLLADGRFELIQATGARPV